MTNSPKTPKLADLQAFTKAAEDRAEARDAFWAAFGRSTRKAPTPRTKSVKDLLGSVLALSARTRRMVQPRAFVELDVFAPGGTRAVRLFMRETSEL